MDSEDYNSDETKRKRDDEAEYELFKRSRRTHRTPAKTSDDTMSQMMKLMKELAVDVKEIKSEQITQGEDTKTLKREIKELRREQMEYRKEIMELKDINEKAMVEINELRKEIEANNGRIERLENEKRKKNIVVQGMIVNTDDSSRLRVTMEKLLEEEVGVNVIVNTARKLGEKTCLVELNSEENKIKVMKNKSKLKNRAGDKIFINDDLNKEDRGIQSRIRQRANEEKRKGKHVKIGYKKLTIENEVWTWNRGVDNLERIGTTSNIEKK